MKENDFALIIKQTKGIVLVAINRYIFSEFYDYIDDIVQETYLRAYKSLKNNKFRSEAKLNSWLFAIARNETLRMNMKLSKFKKIEQKHKENFKNNTVALNKIESNHPKNNVIKKAIQELDDKYKDVIELYIQEYKEKEISEMLKIKTGTIRSLIYRAKRKIQKKLGENYA
ncbi:MAG: RNA polymerase sigma factor [Candidatus Cloacimonetes bacterium]|nr:RNA polymerase sigma factor [Candidatus Cloacimonadota bacterium]